MWEVGAKWGGKGGEKCEKLGRWRERIEYKGEVGVLGGVLGGVKDGGRGEKDVFRDVKNGSGGETVGARTWLMGTMV